MRCEFVVTWMLVGAMLAPGCKKSEPRTEPAAPAGPSRFGVAIYPGAAYDPDCSRQMSQAFYAEFHCYRTEDSLAQVAAFFQKNPELTADGIGAEVARFNAVMSRKLDSGILVQVRNPWLDKDGTEYTDTLIQISREAPEGGR
jgi:hypothetical protein